LVRFFLPAKSNDAKLSCASMTSPSESKTPVCLASLSWSELP
jgi:hypothetical protein